MFTADRLGRAQRSTILIGKRYDSIRDGQIRLVISVSNFAANYAANFAAHSTKKICFVECWPQFQRPISERRCSAAEPSLFADRAEQRTLSAHVFQLRPGPGQQHAPILIGSGE